MGRLALPVAAEVRSKLVQAIVRAERRRLQRAEQQRVREIVHDGNPLVPSVRKRAIVDGSGHTIRGPTASRAAWRIPRTTTRAPARRGSSRDTAAIR